MVLHNYNTFVIFTSVVMFPTLDRFYCIFIHENVLCVYLQYYGLEAASTAGTLFSRNLSCRNKNHDKEK